MRRICAAAGLARPLLPGRPAGPPPGGGGAGVEVRATVRLGAGASTTPGRGEGRAVALSCVLRSEACAAAARRFAARYAEHSPPEESGRAVAEVLG